MKTNVVTWSECISDPWAEVNAIAPIEKINTVKTLGYASEAQFQLQERSRAVHRVYTVKVSEIDDESKILQLQDDVWRVTDIRRVLGEQLIGFIKLVSLKELRRLQLSQTWNSDPSYGPYRCAIDKRKLYFSQIPNDTEYLHIDYDPMLLSYTVSSGKQPGDWNGADPNSATFDKWLQSNGPEEEFWMEKTGIKGYVAMKLLQSMGNMYIKMNYGMYLEFKGAWEKSLLNVAGNQPDNTINDRPAAYIGPVD